MFPTVADFDRHKSIIESIIIEGIPSIMKCYDDFSKISGKRAKTPEDNEQTETYKVAQRKVWYAVARLRNDVYGYTASNDIEALKAKSAKKKAEQKVNRKERELKDATDEKKATEKNSTEEKPTDGRGFQNNSGMDLIEDEATEGGESSSTKTRRIRRKRSQDDASDDMNIDTESIVSAILDDKTVESVDDYEYEEVFYLFLILIFMTLCFFRLMITMMEQWKSPRCISALLRVVVHLKL